MGKNDERTPNEPPRFGPLLIWTAASAVAALLYAGIYGMWFQEVNLKSWYPHAVFAALSAAPVGLVVGLAHDFVQKW